MNNALPASVVLAFGLLIGCAAPNDDSEAAASSDLSADDPAFRVEATWGLAYTGTPTYGYDPRTPYIQVAVRVDDAAVRRDHEGFDGYETPFALVPRADGTWNRIALGFRGTSHVGYIQVRPVDVYESETLLMSQADFDVVRAKGIAVAMETNVGIVWAQREGENFHVSPTSR